MTSGDEEIKLSYVRHLDTIRVRRRARMKPLVLIILSLSLSRAMPATKDEGLMASFVSALTDCVERDTMLCLKEKAMKYTENLAVSKELNIADGISFSRTGSPRSARSYQPLSDDPIAREVQIEERILDNVIDFLDNHVVQLRMPKSFMDNNSLDEEGRGKKKKKLKKLLPILALLKLKFAALIPLFLGIIAFAVFKAYVLGKIAFVAAAFGSLKKLLDAKKSSGWSEPVHEEHGWESGGGWGRASIPNSQDLAYSGHVKQS